MPALVTNFGPTRVFETCAGGVRIAASATVEIGDDKVAAEIERHPLLKVAWRHPFRRRPPLGRETAMRYPINFLRQKARAAGIKGCFFMKKEALIKALEAL